MPRRLLAPAIAAAALLAAPAAAHAAEAAALLPPSTAFGAGWSSTGTRTITPEQAQRFDGPEAEQGAVTSAAVRQYRRAKRLARGGRREGSVEVELHRDAEAAGRRFELKRSAFGATLAESPLAVPELGQGSVGRRIAFAIGRRRFCGLGALVLEGTAIVHVSVVQPRADGCAPASVLRGALVRAHARVRAAG